MAREGILIIFGAVITLITTVSSQNLLNFESNNQNQQIRIQKQFNSNNNQAPGGFNSFQANFNDGGNNNVQSQQNVNSNNNDFQSVINQNQNSQQQQNLNSNNNVQSQNAFNNQQFQQQPQDQQNQFRVPTGTGGRGYYYQSGYSNRIAGSYFPPSQQQNQQSNFQQQSPAPFQSQFQQSPAPFQAQPQFQPSPAPAQAPQQFQQSQTQSPNSNQQSISQSGNNAPNSNQQFIAQNVNNSPNSNQNINAVNPAVINSPNAVQQFSSPQNSPVNSNQQFNPQNSPINSNDQFNSQNRNNANNQENPFRNSQTQDSPSGGSAQQNLKIVVVPIAFAYPPPAVSAPPSSGWTSSSNSGYSGSSGSNSGSRSSSSNSNSDANVESGWASWPASSPQTTSDEVENELPKPSPVKYVQRKPGTVSQFGGWGVPSSVRVKAGSQGQSISIQSPFSNGVGQSAAVFRYDDTPSSGPIVYTSSTGSVYGGRPAQVQVYNNQALISDEFGWRK